ncbi:hypothetical protein MSG28_006659 [Choristoneura fumiferana]|uniref:Uncharacterized protein n=1 Tax=Choristoneura fumiferana TaxID=7141 RepID=A0ACC0JKW4_CHOFU|nr:hypothetical protein MSG28_006659 [Choristoneura fumiferana]
MLLASAGREAVQRELGRYVPVARLRYYFAVDTRYVIRKLLLILFPYTHKDWMVKYDQESPVQPRYDLNAPDLYLPAMGYHRFSPEQIGMQASSALAYIIFEMILYLVTLYITNTSTNLKTLDLVAFSGYKYIPMIVSLLGTIRLGGANASLLGTPYGYFGAGYCGLRGAQSVRGALGQAGRHQAPRLLPPVRGAHAAAAVLVADLPSRAERRRRSHATAIIHVLARDVPASREIRPRL